MKFYKLVRDKVPSVLRDKGKIPIIHFADEKEYWEKLKEKLREEVNEFLENEKEEELVDILEVIYAICDFKRIKRKELELIRKRKKEKRGGFKDGVILEEVR